SKHDEINHHYRRYTRRQLTSRLGQNGFRLLYGSYFNTLLFPVAVAAIVLSRLAAPGRSSARGEPAPIINSVLKRVFSSERWLVPRMRMPFGLSIMVVAELPR